MSGTGGPLAPGVYRLHDNGARSPVHGYLDDTYELNEIAELLDIGTLVDGGNVLTLTGRERRLLKVTADAQSFDHAPEFISMCLDIAAMDIAPEDDVVRLVSEG